MEGEPRPRLVLATANQGKVVELADLLGERYDVAPRPDGLAETVEDGDTLVENALKKAREVVANTATLALADDTGLFVAALGGAPGVLSARYAGPQASSEDNIAKLLGSLAGSADRSAYFETVLALVSPDGTSVIARGRVDGHIVAEPRGASGFGYDSVFAPSDGDGRTFAEMSSAEKQKISHRSRALRDVKNQVEAKGDSP